MDNMNNQYGQTGQSFDNANATGQNSQYGQANQNFNGQNFGSNQTFGGPNLSGQGFGNNQNFVGMNAPDYMLWLILGIIQILALCCCNCVGPITGIITVIMVVSANNLYKSGDAVNYSSKMNIAKIVCCIGFGLMLVGWIIGIISGIFESIVQLF